MTLALFLMDLGLFSLALGGVLVFRWMRLEIARQQEQIDHLKRERMTATVHKDVSRLFRRPLSAVVPLARSNEPRKH